MDESKATSVITDKRLQKSFKKSVVETEYVLTWHSYIYFLSRKLSFRVFLNDNFKDFYYLIRWKHVQITENFHKHSRRWSIKFTCYEGFYKLMIFALYSIQMEANSGTIPLLSHHNLSYYNSQSPRLHYIKNWDMYNPDRQT